MGRGLLGHALLHRKARLAVVASAFSDVSYLQCREAWKRNWEMEHDRYDRIKCIVFSV